uniref:Uncharacterized protein n=1 Tax=Plectus sambesii TaxID=2011161 RepID=A0A914VW91_9BILA
MKFEHIVILSVCLSIAASATEEDELPRVVRDRCRYIWCPPTYECVRGRCEATIFEPPTAWPQWPEWPKTRPPTIPPSPVILPAVDASATDVPFIRRRQIS